MIHPLFFALLTVLILPSSAYAWGGGTHLELGTYILNNFSILPFALDPIIKKFHDDFLYGCLAADITIAKKYNVDYVNNCHSWDVGRNVLKQASTGPQRACAYGYLAHLAADTIAHNYYVPLRIIESFSTLTMKHAYWEVRFDSFVDRGIWETGGRVARENFEANDKLLRDVVKRTLFPFATNKRIFNSVLLVSRLEKWQQAIRKLNETSRFELVEDHRDEILELSKNAVIDVLGNFEDSRFVKKSDPTGVTAFAVADGYRKNLRLLYQSGKISKSDSASLVEEIEGKLYEAICNPGLLQEILADAAKPSFFTRLFYCFNSKTL